MHVSIAVHKHRDLRKIRCLTIAGEVVPMNTAISTKASANIGTIAEEAEIGFEKGWVC